MVHWNFFSLNSWLEKAVAALVCQWEVPRLLWWDGCRVTAKNGAFLSLLGVVSTQLYSKIIPADFIMLEENISNVIGFRWTATKEKQTGHMSLSPEFKLIMCIEQRDRRHCKVISHTILLFSAAFSPFDWKLFFSSTCSLKKCWICIYDFFSCTLKIFLKVAFIL